MVADPVDVQPGEDTSEEIPIPDPYMPDPDARRLPACGSWLHAAIPSEHTYPCDDDGPCACAHCVGDPCECDECPVTRRGCQNCLYDPFCEDCLPC